jgi:hypothetical protein
MDKRAIALEDLSSPVSAINGISSPRSSKDVQELNSAVDRQD